MVTDLVQMALLTLVMVVVEHAQQTMFCNPQAMVAQAL
jgi:hypothetical protein